MPEIVRANDEHWPLIREIRLRALSADPHAFGQSWETESTYDDAVWRERVNEAAWFLALDNDDPVAIVASRHEKDSPETERELQAMWVQSDFRGHGLAHDLADAVVEWARTDGAETLALYVHPSNEPAVALYKSLGFTSTGERWQVDEDDPQADWVKMAKVL